MPAGLRGRKGYELLAESFRRELEDEKADPVPETIALIRISTAGLLTGMLSERQTAYAMDGWTPANHLGLRPKLFSLLEHPELQDSSSIAKAPAPSSR